jgi:hypothetical protein
MTAINSECYINNFVFYYTGLSISASLSILCMNNTEMEKKMLLKLNHIHCTVLVKVHFKNNQSYAVFPRSDRTILHKEGL